MNLREEVLIEVEKFAFLRDVAEQPEVLVRVFTEYSGTLFSRLDFAASRIRTAPLTVAFGMGSSYYAAELFALYLNAQGMPVFALDASELLHYRKALLSNCIALVGVSQSGESIETCLVAENRPTEATLVSVTNVENSRLARVGDVVLPLLAGKESGTSSKTFIATVAVLYALASAVLLDNRFSLDHLKSCVDIMRGIVDGGVEEARVLASSFEGSSIIYVGRGPGLVSALQSALITKEIACVHAEGMSAGQFRHGPIELVGPETLIVIFAPSGSTIDLLIKLAKEVAEYGSPTWLVTDESVDVPREPNLFVTRFPVVEESLSPLISIVASEFFAAYLGERKGRIPGELVRAKKVTMHE